MTAVGRQLPRRDLLRAAAGAAGLLATGAGLAACTGGSGKRATTSKVTAAAGGQQVGDVTGRFSWQRARGTRLKVLLVEHAYTRALIADLDSFRRLTGIEIAYRVVPEATYFDAVTADLLAEQATYDAFMTGAYMVWQYGPPGWMENLQPWLDNPAATAADYDLQDIYPHLRAADRWDFLMGSQVGAGGQWAMPFGCESNVIAYQADLFRRLGLRPPGTLAELADVAAAYQHGAGRLGVRDPYGIAVRGSRSWATVHPGFMTQYVREGGKDFSVSNGQVVPQFTTDASVRFHTEWMDMVRESGPPDWTSYDYQDCARDLGSRRAGMMYDATTAGFPANQPGASRAAGKLAWAPGPAGPDGSLATNLWVWSLALHRRSRHKPAAWLWLQWATGYQHLMWAALERGHVDPVRASVAESAPYRRRMARNSGYLETIDAVRDDTRVLFTPQPHFFDTTTRWAGALHDIHAGADPRARLAILSQELAARL